MVENFSYTQKKLLNHCKVKYDKKYYQDELDAHEASFNVISSNFNDDNTQHSSDSNQPDDTFLLKNPELEDFYFVMLRNDEPHLLRSIKMFFHIYSFEIWSQFKRPLLYIYAGVMFLLALFTMAAAAGFFI